VDIYDFTKEADGDYSREAAAYEELDPMFGGKQIPKYHGSWTCNMPTPMREGNVEKTVHRPVRLILMDGSRANALAESALLPLLMTKDWILLPLR
jgi:hypothetical protein